MWPFKKKISIEDVVLGTFQAIPSDIKHFASVNNTSDRPINIELGQLAPTIPAMTLFFLSERLKDDHEKMLRAFNATWQAITSAGHAVEPARMWFDIFNEQLLTGQGQSRVVMVTSAIHRMYDIESSNPANSPILFLAASVNSSLNKLDQMTIV